MNASDWAMSSNELAEDTALLWMWRVTAPVLLAAGTVSNTFGLLVLTVTPAFRGRRGGAIGFALSALCCVDIGLLLTSLLRQCLSHSTEVNLIFFTRESILGSSSR